MALIDGLISYWKLDEASGNALDAHGDNDLTDNFNVGATVSGKINGARDFDGTGYFSISDNESLSLTGNFTFAVWVKADDLSENRGVIGKWMSPANTKSYGIRYDTTSDQFLFFVSPGSVTGISIASTVSGGIGTGTWYFIVVWHDADKDEIGISVNAGPPATQAHAGGVWDSDSPFEIGRGTNPNLRWDGLIDEVGVWGRVLSSSEISELYNGGDGLAYPFADAPESPTATGLPSRKFIVRPCVRPVMYPCVRPCVGG